MQRSRKPGVWFPPKFVVSMKKFKLCFCWSQTRDEEGIWKGLFPTTRTHKKAYTLKLRVKWNVPTLECRESYYPCIISVIQGILSLKTVLSWFQNRIILRKLSPLNWQLLKTLWRHIQLLIPLLFCQMLYFMKSTHSKRQ